MAATRPKPPPRFDPYKNFKFRLVWDGRTAAGFNTVTPASVMKITGLNKATDVTLKRGVIGSSDLFDWLNSVRGGRPKVSDRRDLTIEKYGEDGRKLRAVTMLRCCARDFHALPDIDAEANIFTVMQLVLQIDGARQDFSLPGEPKKSRRAASQG